MYFLSTALNKIVHDLFKIAVLEHNFNLWYLVLSDRTLTWNTFI